MLAAARNGQPGSLTRAIGGTTVKDRIPAEVEVAWDSFHQVVNMPSEELREWLLTQASGETAMPADPDLGLPELGRKVVGLLRKRKVDLTAADADVMQEVVDYVADRQSHRPPTGASDDHWRRSLMSVGHDPLRVLGLPSRPPGAGCAAPSCGSEGPAQRRLRSRWICSIASTRQSRNRSSSPSAVSTAKVEGRKPCFDSAATTRSPSLMVYCQPRKLP